MRSYVCVFRETALIALLGDGGGALLVAVMFR